MGDNPEFDDDSPELSFELEDGGVAPETEKEDEAMPQTEAGNYTFPDGSNRSLRAIILSILAALSRPAAFPLGVNWSVRVESGGPVAEGNSAMAAITDGRSILALDEESTPRYDDSTKIYFRPTAANDVISVRFSSRN